RGAGGDPGVEPEARTEGNGDHGVETTAGKTGTEYEPEKRRCEMKSWRQNPKSEWRNPKEARRPNVVVRRSGFGIRYSFVIRHSLLVIACCAALFQAPRSAKAQSYSIDWFTIDGGGGTSSGGIYSISGTIGQPDAGTLSGGSYTLEGGFWPGIVVPSTTAAPM